MFTRGELAKFNQQNLLLLKSNGVSERKTIEYKRILEIETGDQKKEFLADISSFANALGGNIFYGISESNGLPDIIDGIKIDNIDKELLKINQLILTGIEPRINGVETFSVQLENQNYVIIIFIPQSMIKPHVVNYSNRWRFYSRDTNGKHALDLSEVKTSIIQSNSLVDKINKFRIERVNRVIIGETPVRMSLDSKMILHLIPMNNFGNVRNENFHNYFVDKTPPRPMSSSGWNDKINFDGFLSYSPWHFDNKLNKSYVQFFKDGTVEAVDCTLLVTRNDGKKFIPSVAYERNIIKAVGDYLSIIKDLGFGTPIAVFISFIGIKDYYLAVDEYKLWQYDTQFIDRDELLIPEEIINDYNDDVSTILRPTFDAVWNAAGWDKSRNYDSSGKWVGH